MQHHPLEACTFGHSRSDIKTHEAEEEPKVEQDMRHISKSGQIEEMAVHRRLGLVSHGGQGNQRRPQDHEGSNTYRPSKAYGRMDSSEDHRIDDATWVISVSERFRAYQRRYQ